MLQGQAQMSLLYGDFPNLSNQNGLFFLLSRSDSPLSERVSPHLL